MVNLAMIWVIRVAKDKCHVVRTIAGIVSGEETRMLSGVAHESLHDGQQCSLDSPEGEHTKFGGVEDPFVKDDDTGTESDPRAVDR